MVVLACCVQSMPVAINTRSSYFLLLPSAFYAWHKAWPTSKIIIVHTLFFLHEKLLLLFLIIANLNHIHHVTCLFNALQFIYSSFEIIISSSLMQQSIWSCKLLHKIALSRMAHTGIYVNPASKYLGNARSEQDSSLPRIFPGWFGTGNALSTLPNIIAVCVIPLESLLIAYWKYLSWTLCLLLFIQCRKVLLVNSFCIAFCPQLQ